MTEMLAYASVAISLIALVASLIALWANRIRKSRLLTKSDEIFTKALELTRSSAEDSEEELISHLVKILSLFATAYSIRTDASCHATIQLLTKEKDDTKDVSLDQLRVETLARSRNINSNKWWSRKTFKESQPLTSDASYAYLLQTGNDYFFSNNLVKENSYYNTSLKSFNSKFGITYLLKEKHWSLPYRSIIVWPIYGYENNVKRKESISLVGFLTIDSVDTDVFSKNRDLHPGKELAKALFPILRQLNRWV